MPARPSLAVDLRRNVPILSISALVVGCIVSLGVFFFLRGQRLMETQLRDQLRTTATVAAQQFDPVVITKIGKDSMPTPEFRDVVKRLQRIRAELPGIRFAYIMRRTGEPMMLEFVADADSLATPKELDRNSDGIVAQDEAASYPGDRYDVSDVPAMQDEAFRQPTVDTEVTIDQWGAFLSGYAPIRDASGKTVAILGLDMDAHAFLTLARSIFSPVAFLLLCVFAFFLALIVAIFLRRRREEALERIDLERSGLMLLTSHQLGSPLTIFRWSLEELLDHVGHFDSAQCKPLVQAVNDHAQNMRHGIDQLVAIFDELQDATQVDSGTLAYSAEMTALHEIIAQVVSGLSSELHQSRQRINQDVDRSLELSLDRKLIGGVLRELLRNAMTFSPPESEITVVAKRGGKCVLIEVRDHGCGIAKAELPRMFDKFTRGATAHLYQPNGSGLGLYIAKGIIERAGGDIWIKSTEGEGTTLTFTLPC